MSVTSTSEVTSLLSPINAFLHCETPQSWIDEAQKEENLRVILTDHLICELKAAQSAMYLLRRYVADEETSKVLLGWLKPYEDFTYRHEGDWQSLNTKHLSKNVFNTEGLDPFKKDMLDKMVMLIKEELHHFYQVLEIMHELGFEYKSVTSSRYANGLLRHVRTYEPEKLIDKLICGAYIEARSCERFAKLAPYVSEDLGKFYVSLLRSEARHFEDYLTLAGQIAKTDISERVAHFGNVERSLIESDDDELRFHSGAPR
ncbi:MULTISPECIES: tRNA isopentenyl-2-thiomethyl-A-37 hydroxylase MiaE [Alteromonas]|uniref:tRNA isopentenyl-2-thiomethyl-A-37 hydroxylase MiaE n=1 Tax=Alteromonas TaxID=226 RepID=UPI00066D4D45|nr:MULTISPECIES: tRNA isopentenyl-2-thiomethyl-A-37 hydroxylase MiaE [Alteromonas]MCG7643872.1 tRNA isopentenyl-2-thiomethyl-A-37 hydroxylase MiaE [Alteromonas sp. MmMcT2-2]MCG7650787.1 tRNA isopentenyl-2-thiomethyl-A-37 hydroxylase MiaE [Alteromonas sp. MmMcT2-5]CAI3962555.1 tRNA-(ms[2]io[6]A)-hydroxylase [Alteromonas macleodii]VTP53629.1 tRNA-(ms[2]io[6]A)-hydroxylase [Alteromonas macleodii]